MSVFSIPVTIGVDEEKIAKEIQSNVEAQVVRAICDEVKKVMFTSSNYYSDRLDSDEPLRNMVKREIVKVITKKEDVIIAAAAEALADKLVRTKAVKEKAGLVAEKVAKK